MKSIDINKALRPLFEYAREAAKEAIIITEKGIPKVALFPIQNGDPESVSLLLNPKFLSIIKHSRARHRKEGGISSDEMWSRLSLNKSRTPNISTKKKRK